MKYFSSNGIRGKNAIYNYIQSDRSDGKTFDIFNNAIRLTIKKGYQSIYVRRYDKTITKTLKKGLISDVVTKMYPNVKHKLVDGVSCINIPEWGEEVYKDCVYYGSLNDIDDLKSQFNPELIREIHIDEYCPVTARFLPKEMEIINELYESADRNRGVVKLFVYGNRARPINPFTAFFNLTSELTNIGIKTYRGGALAVQSWGSEENRNARKSSAYHKLIAGTNYADYLEDGKTLNTEYNKYASEYIVKSVFSQFRGTYGTGSIVFDGDCFVITTKKYKTNTCVCDDQCISNETGMQNISVKFNSVKTILRNAFYKNKLCYENKESERAFYSLLQELYL